MPVRVLLFDLDQTLYARDAGVMQNIGLRIQQYIEEVLGYSPAAAFALRQEYFQRYGTSMRGLILHHDLDADDFLAFVHGFPLNGLLQADPALDAALSALPPLQKVIFTNADRPHVDRVLARLGVSHHFERVVDVVAVNYISKPAPEAFTRCLELIQAQASECVLIEDSARNVAQGAELGMITVLVDGDRADPADYHIADIYGIVPVVQRICQGRGCLPATSRGSVIAK